MNRPLSSMVRMQKARTTLLLDHPFFGTLLFRLGAQARSSIATMATDGVSLYFNPQFVETLSAAEIAGTLAHEVMHPALQHHTRRGGRNPRRWNMACDYAINPMLLDAGLTLPKDVLLDNRFRGMSAERIYNLLEEEEQNQSSSTDAESERQDDFDSGGGSNSSESSSSEEDMDDPHAPQTAGGIGQVLDAPELENGEGDTVAEQARDWQIAVEQAEDVAKLAESCLPESRAASKRLRPRASTGGSCCVVPGRRPFRLTTVGHVPTAAMCGTVSTCQASSAKVWVRSVSRSTAPAPSTPVSLACSRRRSAPSSRASCRGSSMFCTSIPRCRRSKPTRRASP
jgi:Putative metallopeptidase domain